MIQTLVDKMVKAAARRPRQLIMHPDDVRAVWSRALPEETLNTHQFHGVPVRADDLVPRGQVWCFEPAVLAPVDVATGLSVNAGSYPKFDKRADYIKEQAKGLAKEFHAVAESAAGTTDALVPVPEHAWRAALAVSSRMLPPPEFCDQATSAAAAAGMSLEWCQEVSEQAGGTDTWAHIRTRRGYFDVRPASGESWTQALAAAGVVIPLP